ncbi:ribosomal protein S18-alanine N-acetyltransferase [Ihubacter sp. mB4P-1]
MDEILIRLGTAADVDDMADLEQRCFDDPWSEQALAEDMENPRCLYVVAELDGRVVGYVGFWAIVDEGHINNVAVSPDFRRRRIGAALIEEALRLGTELGLVNYTLEVRAGNEAAIGLYEKFGFEAVGVRPHYYEVGGEDAVIMWRFG